MERGTSSSQTLGCSGRESTNTKGNSRVFGDWKERSCVCCNPMYAGATLLCSALKGREIANGSDLERKTPRHASVAGLVAQKINVVSSSCKLHFATHVLLRVGPRLVSDPGPRMEAVEGFRLAPSDMIRWITARHEQLREKVQFRLFARENFSSRQCGCCSFRVT